MHEVPGEKFFDKMGDLFMSAIRFILNLLLLLVVIALAVGIIKAGVDLFHAINQPLEKILQGILLDVVFILALTEIAITIVDYLKDGRVHVRYIVDTILIIMLNEVISLWFKHPTLAEAIGVSVIIATLGGVRVLVTKLSPDK